MAASLRFDQIRLPPECAQLREEVRAFLAQEIAAGTFDPSRPRNGDLHSPQLSRRIGARGWIGMTWPKKYGGHERSFLERYVVTEEFRVGERAGSPAFRGRPPERPDTPQACARAHQGRYPAAHLPRRGVLRDRHERAGFGLGPVRRQDPGDENQWRLVDHRQQNLDQQRASRRLHAGPVSAHHPPTKENRRHGLTQFLVDMRTPGIRVNPIYQMTGQHDFNEVVFEDAFVPDDHVLGEIDGAWKQATSELAYERSGPERFLETFYVLSGFVRAVGPKPDLRSAEGLGRLVAQLHTLRRMSVSVERHAAKQARSRWSKVRWSRIWHQLGTEAAGAGTRAGCFPGARSC